MKVQKDSKDELLALALLGAISGVSFLFSRVAVEQFPPVLVAAIRTIFGGGLVLAYGRIIRQEVRWRGNITIFFVVGILNFAGPFVLYSYSAKLIPTAYSAVLNAMAPLISSLLAWLVLKETLGAMKMFGLLLGIVGVVAICFDGLANSATITGVLLCLIGAASYAAGGVYTKVKALKLNVVSIAGAAQFLSGILLLPMAANNLPVGELKIYPILAIIALVIVNSAIAYVLYFTILVKYGPTKALTITFLAPVFAGMWGYLILGEKLSSDFLAGACVIGFSVGITTGVFGNITERIKNVYKAL